MDKNLNKGIRRFLFLNSFLGSFKALSTVLNEVDKEVEELFDNTNKYIKNIKKSNDDSEI